MEFKKIMPKVYCGLGMIGVGMTAYLAANETPKALKLIEEAGVDTFADKAKVCWKVYIPAIASGIITCGMIAAAFSELARENARLALAYGFGQTAVKLYSERSTPEVRKEVAAEAAKINVFPLDPVSVSDNKVVLWKDYISGQEFNATRQEVKEAIAEYNESVVKKNGEGSLNQLYDLFKKFSEIDNTGEQGENLGWRYTPEYPEVIPLIYAGFSRDGLPCVMLDFVNPPQYGYDNKFA